MADDLDDPSLTNRLMSRNGPGLSTRRMADGGEVVGGPTAKRALKAVGARAMTMDHTIFVDDGFDASNPEDAALYAHERHHQMESGGADENHGPRDEEEIAARAIERMVLHRASAGEGIGEIMNDVKAGNIDAPPAGGSPGAGGQTGSAEDGDPMGGYKALRGQGLTHPQIIRELTDFVTRSLMQIDEDEAVRRSGRDHT